jgi:hypothetical protein
VTDTDNFVIYEKIRTQLYLYCQGVDKRDWSLVRSCFAAEHQHRHGSFAGSLDEFIGFASHVMGVINVSHHSISNVVIHLDDDGLGARTESKFTAVHFIAAEVDTEGFFIETKGVATDWLVAGSYCDRWVYRDGQWLIVERDAAHDWERLEDSRPRE